MHDYDNGSIKSQRRRFSTAASLASTWEERPSPAAAARGREDFELSEE